MENTPDFSDIITPDGIGIQIDDVNTSVWNYIRHRKLLEAVLIVPAVMVWEALAIWLYLIYLQSADHSDGRGFGYMFAGPFILLSGWFYKIKKQFEDAFLEEFARSNNYTFAKSGTVDETYGSIFRIHGTHTVSDIVSGTYKGNGIRLFLHDLDAGRNSKYHNTILEIDLNGQLPQLLMLNKFTWSAMPELSMAFGITNKFSLEGDFDEHFTLYGNEENRIEALEVFAPDTMALLEDHASGFSVEFAGNRIYIYAPRYIGNSHDLVGTFALAKKLIEKIGPIAFRLEQYDEKLIPTPVNVLPSSTNVLLQRGFRVYFISLMAFFGVVTVFGIITIFARQ